MAVGFNRLNNYNNGTSGFATRVLSKLPWGLQTLDDLTELNPKYEIFSKLMPDRETRLARMSVSTSIEDLVNIGRCPISPP